MYFLYEKTHKQTGLKYLGQTKENPYLYTGSGIDWRKHLKEYGSDIDTYVLFQSEIWNEIVYWGRYYSQLYNIVNAQDDFGNKIWANRIPETGGGGGNWNEETKLKHKMSLKASHSMSSVKEIDRLNGIKSANLRIQNKTHNLLGSNNVNFDHKIHEFYHNDGTVENVTRKEMMIKYDYLSHSGMSLLINGLQSHHKGWRVR